MRSSSGNADEQDDGCGVKRGDSDGVKTDAQTICESGKDKKDGREKQ